MHNRGWRSLNKIPHNFIRTIFLGVPPWLSRLRMRHCHCCDSGHSCVKGPILGLGTSMSGPGTYECLWCGKKKKKKNNISFLEFFFFMLWLLLWHMEISRRRVEWSCYCWPTLQFPHPPPSWILVRFLTRLSHSRNSQIFLLFFRHPYQTKINLPGMQSDVLGKGRWRHLETDWQIVGCTKPIRFCSAFLFHSLNTSTEGSSLLIEFLKIKSVNLH